MVLFAITPHVLISEVTPFYGNAMELMMSCVLIFKRELKSHDNLNKIKEVKMEILYNVYFIKKKINMLVILYLNYHQLLGRQLQSILQ